MRRVLLAIALALGPAAAPATAQEPPAPPNVVCITGFDPVESAYLHQPNACIFHRRNAFPVAGANTFTTDKLRWRAWTDTEARAVGKYFISTVGPSRLKLRLSDPQAPCGTTVFTEARFRYTLKFNGETHRDSFRVHLDDCLV